MLIINLTCTKTKDKFSSNISLMFFKMYFCLYSYLYLFMYIFMHEGTSRGQRRALNPLELVIGSCDSPDVGGGIQTLVLCRGSKCS